MVEKYRYTLYYEGYSAECEEPMVGFPQGWCGELFTEATKRDAERAIRKHIREVHRVDVGED